MRTHELKIWPDFFDAVRCGAKKFELRKDDRDYQTGDVLILREYDPETQTYTGRQFNAVVTYTLRDVSAAFGLLPGYVLMSVEVQQ